MFIFESFTIDTIDAIEYENSYANKNFFCTIEWLKFIKEFRKVEPVIIRITDVESRLVGHFTGATFIKMGLKIMGSPFYGWMGLQMGFDFIDLDRKYYGGVLDELIDYVKTELMVVLLILTDYKYCMKDLVNCKNKLFTDNESKTYFLDLSKTEEEIFEGFKSGYRTCVRKFSKLGGEIKEDYSPDFIIEHNKQLKDVFTRKSLTAPDYSKRMYLLIEHHPDIILFIKALDQDGRNIASSYFIGDGDMAFFASNASYSSALKYNANQALMWYAIRYWRNKGIKLLDLAGSGDYKANFGSKYKTTPIIIWAKQKWMYVIIQKLRDIYYYKFRIRNRILSVKNKPKTNEMTDKTPE